MKIILAEATSFAGGEVLWQALAAPDITQVTVLTRRSVGFVHPKLQEVLMRNFLDYAACIWPATRPAPGASAHGRQAPQRRRTPGLLH